MQLARNMGLRYTGYRIKHELEKRSGLLRKRHPISPPERHFISLDEWRRKTPPFFFDCRELIGHNKNPHNELQFAAENIFKGKIRFFNHEWLDLGLDYDWVTHPQTGFVFHSKKHWSDINDFGVEQGDIKYVWEKSRFTFILDLIRYDYHFDKDSSEFVFGQIEDWIDKNPINQGPNWKCSQETSLRIANWCFALNFYKNAPCLTEERWSKIQQVIYWSLHHIYNHIDFSRIAVRNNHAITETMMLALSNMLFPFIPETEKWASAGRLWFEEEIAYQVYEDGTFLQFSMNYHRVVVQLLSFAISLSEIHLKPFASVVYDRAYKSVNFLYQCQNEKDGYLPNYGANDGALFFPWASQVYRDYRPQLNCLHYILTGKRLSHDSDSNEELSWFASKLPQKERNFKPIEKETGLASFPIGGYYLIRDTRTFTFIRCGNHKDRPQQADNLHVDIWVDGKNLLRDSGSYKYNVSPEIIPYFQGTRGHNTVSLGNFDQMFKGSRFIWFYWTQAPEVKLIETDKEYIFEGCISAFGHLRENIIHKRVIKKSKIDLHWEVQDEILNGPDILSLHQYWHGNFEEFLDITATDINKKEVLPLRQTSKYSSHYGYYEGQPNWVFISKSHFLSTHISSKLPQ